jgi:hypothetical protein
VRREAGIGGRDHGRSGGGENPQTCGAALKATGYSSGRVPRSASNLLRSTDPRHSLVQISKKVAKFQRRSAG